MSQGNGKRRKRDIVKGLFRATLSSSPTPAPTPIISQVQLNNPPKNEDVPKWRIFEPMDVETPTGDDPIPIQPLSHNVNIVEKKNLHKEIWDDKTINIYIVGDAVSGKSFLLNSIFQSECITKELAGNRSITEPNPIIVRNDGEKDSGFVFNQGSVHHPTSQFYESLKLQQGRFYSTYLNYKSQYSYFKYSNFLQPQIDDENTFLIPQGNFIKPTIHFGYHGYQSQVIVTYPTLESIKNLVYQLKVQNFVHLTQKQQQTLLVHLDRILVRSDFTKIDQIQIKNEYLHLLGKTICYRAIGNFLNDARFYIRETLKSIFTGIGCFVEDLIVLIPLEFLKKSKISVYNTDGLVGHHLYTRQQSVPQENHQWVSLNDAKIVIVPINPKLEISPSLKDFLQSPATRVFLTNLEKHPGDYHLLFTPVIKDVQFSHNNNPNFINSNLQQPSQNANYRSIDNYKLPEYQMRNIIESQLQIKFHCVINILEIHPLIFLIAALNLDSQLDDHNNIKEYLYNSNIPYILVIFKSLSQLDTFRPILQLLFEQVRAKNSNLSSESSICRLKLIQQLGEVNNSILAWQFELKRSKEKMALQIRYLASISLNFANNSFKQFKERYLENMSLCNVLFKPEYNGCAMGADIKQLACSELLKQSANTWNQSIIATAPGKVEKIKTSYKEITKEFEKILSNLSDLKNSQNEGEIQREIEIYNEMLTDFKNSGAFLLQLRQHITIQVNQIVVQSCERAVREQIIDLCQEVGRNPKFYQEKINKQLPAVASQGAKLIIDAFGHHIDNAVNHLQVVFRRINQIKDNIINNDSIKYKELTVKQLKRALDDAAKRCEEEGLFVNSSGGVGNCAFYIKNLRDQLKIQPFNVFNGNQYCAIAHQLLNLNNEKAPKVVELLTIRELINYADFYKLQLDLTEAEYYSYITKLYLNHKYDHLTLFAIANAFQVDILIYSPFLNPTSITPLRIRARDPKAEIQIGLWSMEYYISFVPATNPPSSLVSSSTNANAISASNETVQPTITLVTTPATHSFEANLNFNANLQNLLNPVTPLNQNPNGNRPASVILTRVDNIAPASSHNRTPSGTLFPNANGLLLPLPGRLPLAPDGNRRFSKKFRKTGSFSSRIVQIQPLSTLCIQTIVESLSMLPNLNGALPEELVQSIITECIASGKLTNQVLEKLLDDSVSTLDLSSCTRISDKSCEQIAASSPNLRHISFSNCPQITSEGIKSIAMKCSNLESINLEKCNIDDVAVFELVHHCKGLVSVNLTGCVNIKAESMKEIVKCPKLQILSCKNCTQITENVFEELTDKLMKLDLSDCDQITDSAVRNIAKKSIELKTLKLSGTEITDKSIDEITTCPKLEELKLSGCEKISDSAIITLAKHCSNLIRLDLSNCNVTPSAFDLSSVPSHHFHNLQELNLQSCKNVTDETLSRISAYSQNLISLNLSNCNEITDSGLEKIAEKCHLIQELILDSCVKVTDKSIKFVTQGCPLLRKINLSRCQITDSSLDALSSRCQKMEELDISYCESITDASFRNIYGFEQHLEILNINQLPNITSTSLIHIAKCSKLKSLHVAGSKGFTDEVLLAIAEGCPLVKYLDLSECSSITPYGLHSSIRLLSTLRTLHLKSFLNITTESLAHPYLEELDLSWSSNIQDCALEQIATNCPRLQRIILTRCTNITEKSVKNLLKTATLLNIRGTGVPESVAKLLSTKMCKYCRIIY